LNLRSIALSVLLITTTLISGLSIAEDSNITMKDSETGPTEVVEPMEIVDIDVETVITEDVTVDEETATSVVQSLEGTWIVNMDYVPISMVIYQSEDTLFGAANSDVRKPWNGVVFGSASGDEVELEIHSLMNGVLVSTMTTGTATENTLKGIFIQSDSNGKVNKGNRKTCV